MKVFEGFERNKAAKRSWDSMLRTTRPVGILLIVIAILLIVPSQTSDMLRAGWWAAEGRFSRVARRPTALVRYRRRGVRHAVYLPWHQSERDADC